MTRIALQGSYFGHNFGDILLLSLYRKWIREVVDCEVLLPLATDEAVENVGADMNGFRHLFRSNGLIYAGGGYFGEPPGSHSQIRRWAVRNFLRHIPSGILMSGLGRPVAIIGVGAGPLSDSVFRSSVKRLVERAVIVAVRDEESHQFLRSIGVSRQDLEITADAALTLSVEDIPGEKIEYIKARFPTTNLVGVHLPCTPTVSAHVQLVLNEMEALLDQYHELEIVVMSDNTAYDPAVLAERLAAHHRNRVHLARYRDPWTLVALLSRLRLVITTKLHVGIVATAVGTLPVSFPYHHKTERFYRQIGRTDLCLPLRQVNRGLVARQLRQALEETQDPNYRFELPCKVRAVAYKNRQLVERFVRSVLGNAG